MKNIHVIVLIVFLVAFGVFTWMNHSCNVQSDPITYLRFARSLAHGSYYADYPPEQLLFENLPHGVYFRGFSTNIIRDEKSFGFVAIGYPLFLSLSILVGGIYAPFLANALVFIGLFVALYVFFGLLFRKALHYQLIAILAVLLYFLLNRARIIYLLRCYRDPFSYLLMIIGFCFYLRFFNAKKSKKYLALTALFLGLSCTVRETSVLAIFPMGLLYIVRYLRAGDRFSSMVNHAIVAVIFFAIGCSPLLVQNYVNTGNPIYPTARLMQQVLFTDNNSAIKTDVGSIGVPGLSFKSFTSTSRAYLQQLWEQYGPWFAILFFLGVVYGRKHDEIKYLILPFIAVYFLFYSFYNSSPWRYLFVVHMAIVPVIALGIAAPITSLKKLNKRHLQFALPPLLLFTIFTMFGESTEKKFQMKQARMFKEDLDGSVAPNSVIISERLMRSHLDYFTKSYSFRFDDFIRPKYGITVKKGLDYFLEKFGNVYFFDNTDLGRTHVRDHTPATKQKILSHFNLVPQRKFRGDRYNLDDLFGKPYCTLWKVEKWSDDSVEHSIKLKNHADSILRVNARMLWDNSYDRREAKLYVNGEQLSASVADGLNYFYLPEDLLQNEKLILRLVSDAPVPDDIEPEILGMYDHIVMEIGSSSVPLDTNYISPESIRKDLEPMIRRCWTDVAYRNVLDSVRIRVPTIEYPGSTLLFGASLNLKTDVTSVTISLVFYMDGKEIARIGISEYNKWQQICFPINNDDIRSDMSEILLKVEASLPQGKRFSNTDIHAPFLSIDHFIVNRYDMKSSMLLIDVGAYDDCFIGAGFYDKENHPSGDSVRWTSGSAIVRLPCYRPERRMKIGIRAWGPLSGAGARTTVILVNDQRVGEFEAKPEVMNEYSIEVPEGILFEGFNELKLAVRPWRPVDVGNSSDRRELGILLDSITISYDGDSENESDD